MAIAAKTANASDRIAVIRKSYGRQPSSVASKHVHVLARELRVDERAGSGERPC